MAPHDLCQACLICDSTSWGFTAFRVFWQDPLICQRPPRSLSFYYGANAMWGLVDQWQHFMSFDSSSCGLTVFYAYKPQGNCSKDARAENSVASKSWNAGSSEPWKLLGSTTEFRCTKHNATESLISSNPWGFICSSLPSRLHAPGEAISGQAFWVPLYLDSCRNPIIRVTTWVVVTPYGT